MRTRRDAGDAVLAGFALQASIMLTGILAARLLGPENRGLLALMWIVAFVLSQLGTLGVPAALTVFLGSRRCAPADALRCLRIAALQAAVVFVIHVGVLLLVFGGRGGSVLLAALVTLAAVPAMVAQLYGLAILQGLGHVREMQLLRVLPTASYAIALTVGVVAGAGSLPFVALVWAGAYVGAAALTIRVAVRRARVAPEPEAAQTVARGELLRFGLRALPGAVSPLETFRIDQLLVGLLLSSHDLGLYVTALAFTNLPRFIAQGIGQAAVARIAPLTDIGHIRKAIRLHVAAATAAAFAISLPLALLARPLVDLAFGTSFAGAVPLMQVLLLGTVLVCARRVLGDCLRAAGHPGAGSVAELWSYVALAPALALAVGTVAGAVGIAWAVVASGLVSLLILLALTAARGLLVGGRTPVLPISVSLRP